MKKKVTVKLNENIYKTIKEFLDAKGEFFQGFVTSEINRIYDNEKDNIYEKKIDSSVELEEQIILKLKQIARYQRRSVSSTIEMLFVENKEFQEFNKSKVSRPAVKKSKFSRLIED